MACRGVHFAIDEGVARRLLAAATDRDVMAIVEEIEQAWDRPLLFETDKAWDALHRCLSDGTLSCGGGDFPLSHVFLGGEHLHEGEDYIVALVRPDQVVQIAAALAGLDRAWLHERYEGLKSSDYQGFCSEDDFEYSWVYFRGLPAFFDHAARTGQAVIFTVDQ